MAPLEDFDEEPHHEILVSQPRLDVFEVLLYTGLLLLALGFGFAFLLEVLHI